MTTTQPLIDYLTDWTDVDRVNLDRFLQQDLDVELLDATLGDYYEALRRQNAAIVGEAYAQMRRHEDLGVIDLDWERRRRRDT